MIQATLKSWQNKLMLRWHQLNLNEKRTVGIGGSILAVLFFYMALLKPYTDYIDYLRVKVQASQKTLRGMQAAEQMINAHKNQNQPETLAHTVVERLSLLQAALQSAQLMQYVSVLKQASSDTIALDFKHVPFDKLMRFMVTLNQTQPVIVDQFAANATEAPGVVEVRMMVK